MIKLVLKIASLIALVALAIFAFIKMLPWVIAISALLAAAKYCHDRLCRNAIITPSGFWPWKCNSSGPQNAA